MPKNKNCVICIKTFIHFIHKNKLYLQSIAEDVETRFDNLNYEIDRLLPKGK